MGSRSPLVSRFGAVGSAAVVRPGWYIALLASLLLFLAPGCATFAPNVSHVPEVRNPFPQLSRVAVAPFFNQSDEPTLDARRFSKSYFAQLQDVPGFEVVPLGVVEETILRHQVNLSHPGEARRLAQLLGVDAVVVGSITDYSPYTPPRCGLRVEWYAANPGYHEIPAGYGLPWNTSQEEFIPEQLVYQTEFALARAQLATQAPACSAGESHARSPADMGPALAPPARRSIPDPAPTEAPEQHLDELPLPPSESEDGTVGETQAAYQSAPTEENLWDELEELPSPQPLPAAATTTATTRLGDNVVATAPNGTLPPGWPTAECLTPQAPSVERPPCIENAGPVMTHTRIYHGDDAEFAEALAGYVHFRSDDRFGGWQTHLQRSDDFIRFCCHLHIAEMLTARGGSGKTRVVCEWPASR